MSTGMWRISTAELIQTQLRFNTVIYQTVTSLSTHIVHSTRSEYAINKFAHGPSVLITCCLLIDIRALYMISFQYMSGHVT